MALCEECKVREATVLYVEIVDGVKVVKHLCDVCAEKASLGLPRKKKKKKVEPIFNIKPSTIKGMFQRSYEEKKNLHCKHCGMTWEYFKRAGKFGCAYCYESFFENLQGYLRKLHGTYEYRGRAYRKAGIKTESIIEEKLLLEKELRQAVENEDFEKAAKIRDKIKELNEKITQNKSSDSH